MDLINTSEMTCFRMLYDQKLTLATAESCTGGQIAQRITALSGASRVYRGGVVSYWSEVKRDVLGVDPTILEEHGAVSVACARAMAEGARRITGAEIAVSVTGVAGPDSDERNNPVGRVYLGLATPDGVFTRHLELGRLSRHRIQRLAADKAFELICQYLRGEKL